MRARPTDRRLDAVRAAARLRLHELGCRVFGGVAPRIYRWTWLRHLPRLPFGSKPPPPWEPYGRPPPDELRTAPLVRDEAAADEAYAKQPLHGFFVLHPEAA